MKLGKVFSWAVGLVLGFALPPFAQTSPRNDRSLQSEFKEVQIKRTTQRVGDQLSAIISEFERSGIAGEDVKVLRAIRMVLNRLSEQGMAQVVTLLQQAQ